MPPIIRAGGVGERTELRTPVAAVEVAVEVAIIEADAAEESSVELKRSQIPPKERVLVDVVELAELVIKVPYSKK